MAKFKVFYATEDMVVDGASVKVGQVLAVQHSLKYQDDYDACPPPRLGTDPSTYKTSVVDETDIPEVVEYAEQCCFKNGVVVIDETIIPPKKKLKDDILAAEADLATLLAGDPTAAELHVAKASIDTLKEEFRK